MSEIKDGGPAFPRNILDHGHGVTTTHESGMTMRDYFAAKAMEGFIAYATHKGIYAPPDEELAKVSYQLADAMLKARGHG
jgi:hypothetical protein